MLSMLEGIWKDRVSVMEIFWCKTYVATKLNCFLKIRHCVHTCVMCRVEEPIIEHLRDFVPVLEKYKVAIFLPCMKIEIKRIAKFR